MEQGQILRMQSRPSRRARACKQCRTAKVRCSGGRPCARCTRRHDTCTFPADDVQVSVSESYLRELQRQAAQQRPTPTPTTATTSATSTGPSERQSLVSVSVSASDTDVATSAPRPISLGFATDTIPPTHGDTNASYSSPRRSQAEHAIQESTASPEISVRTTASDEHDASNVPLAYNPLVTRDVAYVRGSDDRRLLFLGHTSTWSFCRRAFKLLEDAACSPDTPRAPLNLDGAAFRLQWQPKTRVDASDLLNTPSVDHALFLYNTVKFRLGELFSIVDDAQFLRLFDEFHKQPLQVAQANVLWFVEYLIILAFGKAFTSYPDQKAAAPSGSELASRALSLLPDVAFLQEVRPAMLAIEVFTLIALYFQSIDMRSPAYHYIGQALRLSLHDGLHRVLSDDVPDDDLASRCSNTWWTVYVLDQELTAALGCPPAVPLSSITTPLPDARSASLTAKALTLRTRLSRLISSACSTIYSFDQNPSSDFVSTITSVLHRLAEVSREIDEVTSTFKANRGEIPQMFYNIMLSHHHCIVLATRPLVIWLLIRSLPPNKLDPHVLAGPIWGLLEKSAQSATATIFMLKNLEDREILETFLSFPLEYAFSSAVLLSILGTILPAHIPDLRWRRAAFSIFGEMVRRGNVVAVLRKAELEHLEGLLEPIKSPTTTMPVQSALELRNHFDTGKMQAFSGPGISLDENSGNQPSGFRTDENEEHAMFDSFTIDADDILALAEQFEQGDFSSAFYFQE
ncbi:hypothetical protein EDB80DRAFT_713441 [Ilyonectria destructans]|nr:hypothetical protein EDB80DRAFT_713441 [Ilyonectria destructans]